MTSSIYHTETPADLGICNLASAVERSQKNTVGSATRDIETFRKHALLLSEQSKEILEFSQRKNVTKEDIENFFSNNMQHFRDLRDFCDTFRAKHPEIAGKLELAIPEAFLNKELKEHHVQDILDNIETVQNQFTKLSELKLHTQQTIENDVQMTTLTLQAAMQSYSAIQQMLNSMAEQRRQELKALAQNQISR